MDEKVITFADAVNMMFLALKERGPDYVYDRRALGLGSCRNVHTKVGDDGTDELSPGCIVGTGVFLGGYITLEDMRVKAPTAPVGGLAGVLEDLHNVRMTARAGSFLAEVQRHQDDTKPWGVSVGYGLLYDKDRRESGTQYDEHENYV